MINTSWGAGFFWRRSGQSLLKCPTRRQRKHLVLLRICSFSSDGAWEPELWLKLRSRLPVFRFCRDSFRRLTAVIHDVNELLGHTQVDRKSRKKSLCDMTHRLRLSRSRQENGLSFRAQACTSEHQVAASDVSKLNPLARSLLEEFPTATRARRRSFTLSTLKRKTLSSDSPILSGVSRSGNRSSRHEKTRTAPFATQRSSMRMPSRAKSATVGLLRSPFRLEECEVGLCPLPPFPASSCRVLASAIKALRGTGRGVAVHCFLRGSKPALPVTRLCTPSESNQPVRTATECYGLLSVRFNDEDVPDYVRDAYVLNRWYGLESST